MARLYEWLTRANDPEARRMIGEVLVRLDRLSVVQGNVYMAPAMSHGLLDLHCGHRNYAHTVYRDGKTSCYDCYDPKRGNVHGSI